MKTQWLAIQVVFATTILISSACLITNCPKGGKRAAYNKEDTIRQCARCGPAKLGHCYGPAICCGPQIGCLVATPDTTRCLEEAASPIPCMVPIGAVCGEGGRCTANGVCCTHDSCSLDVSCRITNGETLELTDRASESIPMFNLYNTISSSYKHEFGHPLIDSE